MQIYPHLSILDRILQFIGTALTEKKEYSLIKSFVQRYYAHVAEEDLVERSIEDLAHMALEHWHFIYQRQPGTSKLRVYNPTLSEHGWTSPNTIVEISHDDMPFLVDTCLMQILRKGCVVKLAIHTGGMKVRRDSEYRVTALLSDQEETDFLTEAPLHFEVTRLSEEIFRDELRLSLEQVLEDVTAINRDWQAMKGRMEGLIEELATINFQVENENPLEVRDFLLWVLDNHFTFLGTQDYLWVEEEKALKLLPASNLGIYRDKPDSKTYRPLGEMPEDFQKAFSSAQRLIIAKTNDRSTVHRDGYLDYISVKRLDGQGKLVGERRFIGLFTSSAYHERLSHVPLLRTKVEQVIHHLQLKRNSHGGKALIDILESFPRDDLFQANATELTTLCRGILALQERSQVRLFIRRDLYGRHFSCLVYLPRERYDTRLQQAIRQILENALAGKELSVSAIVSEAPLARIHYLIHTPKKTFKTLEKIDVKEIEQRLRRVARLWQDDLLEALTEKWGEERATNLFAKYQKAFSLGYQENYTAQVAASDIKKVEILSREKELTLGVYQDPAEPANHLHLKIFKLDDTLSLSVVVPILESLGLSVLDEHPYKVTLSEELSVWVHDFSTVLIAQEKFDLPSMKSLLKRAFKQIWLGKAENDGFNRLILLAKLSWREAALLRAIAKYARQIRFPYSQVYIESTFSRYPDIAAQLIALFKTRFAPSLSGDRTEIFQQVLAAVFNQIAAVSSLDEDRIFRFYVELMNAMLRTNFFQKNALGVEKDYFSFKLAPDLITELPLPRPKFEIFVYSPDFEGIHLRGSNVARGGIRWSDRPEDFRTEVLGLMKAQQVKNAIIVPAGAKGGFYPKKLPSIGDRTLITQVAIACYQDFIRGLLDITDNLQHLMIAPPKEVVRYDQDDPYLVVAADKGTATFSDIANQIAQDYNFWLGDAFASGGSQGYDHKKMGITARGAWESVKRHFARLGIQPDQTFTVVGIGDMSGDVFGNGMLLSKQLQLIGAFNHQHIFLDPNPDPEKSFEERRRLFALPRSTWADYNSSLISLGGGVFDRKAKSIFVSKEAAAVIGIAPGHVEPNALIKALLKAPVDLLWNGGIGTYVKSSQETDAQVGDKSNDAVRVNGEELRCKVVGEGGNLGFSQLARIEYALQGGQNYTDSVDNSGGVNCSDHEVNLKILLNAQVSKGDLSIQERNQLLAKLTEEVAQLVLRDNAHQAEAIDLEVLRVSDLLEVYQDYLRSLVNSGAVNRELEYLPDDKIFAERKAANKSLTRPELAILLSHTKILLKQSLLQTSLPEEPSLMHYSVMAFPGIVQGPFEEFLRKHYLYREICVTQLSNQLINEMGCVFIYRLKEETGASTEEIVRAYEIARSVFELEYHWQSIQSSAPFDAETTLKNLLKLTQVVRRGVRWFLQYARHRLLNLPETIQHFSTALKAISDPAILNEAPLQRLEKGFALLNLINLTEQGTYSMPEVLKTYFEIEGELGLDWLRSCIKLQPANNRWERLAITSLMDQVDYFQSVLTVNQVGYLALQGQVAEKAQWFQAYYKGFDRWQALLIELKADSGVNLLMLSIALQKLSDLAIFTRLPL